MPADRRSIHPGLPGLPWWGALAVAATATIAGIALDADTKELTHIFAALYVLGCVTAVLAVRQSGVFTAVIQPPLLLFCTVPASYWMFHGAAFTGVKAILINCGYPLIERFPLMLFTSAGVLLIGMIRWYLGTSAHSATPKSDPQDAAGPGRLAMALRQLTGKLTAAAQHDRTRTAAPTASRRRRAGERARRTSPPPRRSSSGRASAPARSRHLRPPLEDRPEPRRRRPAENHADQPPARHRPRPSYQTPVAPEPPRRRRPSGTGFDADTRTHHPISQVRYRGTNPADL